MHIFLQSLRKYPVFQQLIQNLEGEPKTLEVSGLVPVQNIHLSLCILMAQNKRGIYIAPNQRLAQKVMEDVKFFLQEEALFLPDFDLVLHPLAAESTDVHYERLSVLYRVVTGKFRILITSAEAVLKKVMTKERFVQGMRQLKLGDEIYPEKFSEELTLLGYEKMVLVEGKGQFSVRGGIIDIFPIHETDPLRIELFGDEIDSIRTFDIANQRSIDQKTEMTIIPAKEIIYDLDEQETIIQQFKQSLQATEKGMSKVSNSVRQILQNRIYEDIERLENEYYFPGMIRYQSLFPQANACVLDYLQDEDVVFMMDPKRVLQKIENGWLELENSFEQLLEKGQILPSSMDTIFQRQEILEKLYQKKVLLLTPFTATLSDFKIQNRFEIMGRSTVSYGGQIQAFFEDIKFHLKSKKKVVLLCGNAMKAQRFMEELQREEVPAKYFDAIDFEPIESMVSVTHGTLQQGFEYVEPKLVVIADKELFGEDKKHTKKKFSAANSEKINAFADISPLDYVVHYAHGIGQYMGIDKLFVGDGRSDYLKIRYADGDHLYVPVAQLDMVQKYIGGGDKTPKLHRLGSGEWGRAKKKVKESLKEIAAELIEIYAKRETTKGYAYSKDTIWQKQMEDLFPYDETTDQLRSIDEIKKNMEQDSPMDRLLCGDVGFGKTEVAIRAMFKAAMDGKQVAYLVPTTVLAYQHYENFKERFRDFPVTIQMLSRFKTATEQKKIVQEIQKGLVDIVVGTHRLVQKDIRFKDLGLVVIDEEQRFGVAHKERLKQLKTNIDVLTLTATPIPRTLHMSLVGIRDISVLEEPPQDRHPVQTYVLEQNDFVIKEAIEREMSRGGQIFYLFNTIRSIEMKKAQILQMIPDVRVQIAHGQMSKTLLEEVMQDFLERKFDVLLCSTIIESGLDFPNVNTILVEDSDRLGLSQLYQIRGRVGRSNRIAYAYLLYRKDKILSEVAQKRLMAIREFTELGSGFKIAMRDLEIRGAGNILGPQQHGHMDTVGYDMYMRLLHETVSEMKGSLEEQISDVEITVDMQMDAYIPTSYIANEIHKLNMYKKVATIETENEYQELMDEFIDRFGDPTRETVCLMQISLIRALAKGKSIEWVGVKGEYVNIQFLEGTKIPLETLTVLMKKYQRTLLFNASKKPYLSLQIKGLSADEILQNVKVLLQDFDNLQNSAI